MKTLKRSALAFLMLGSLAVCAAQNVDQSTREIADLLQLHPGMSVADLGAGNGEWSFALAKIVRETGQVFSTEVDANKLAQIERSRKRRHLSQVKTVLGNQTSTGLLPGSVDAVLIRLAYHHFVHPEEMQAELKRALKPGGRIAIIDFSPNSGLSRSSVPRFRHGHGVVAETVIQEMESAGFRLEERRDGWDGRQDRYLLIFSLG